MTPDDVSAPTIGEHPINPNHDIAVLESIVQHAVKTVPDFTTLFAQIKAIAHYAIRADITDEDRRWAMSVVELLSEQAETDSQQHHDALRLTASRYWMKRYGGNVMKPARH